MFQYNGAISKLNDLIFFTKITSVSSLQMTSALTEAELPPNVVTIGDGLFRYNSLSVLMIPEKVTTVQGNFLVGGTTKPIVVLKPKTPPSLGGFTGPTLTALYVPDESLQEYKVNTSTRWKSWYSNITFGYSQLAIDYPEYYAKYIE